MVNTLVDEYVGFVPHKFRFPLPPLNPKNLNLNSVTPKTFSKIDKVQGLNKTGESGVDLATSVLGYNVTRKRCKIYKINTFLLHILVLYSHQFFKDG